MESTVLFALWQWQASPQRLLRLISCCCLSFLVHTAASPGEGDHARGYACDMEQRGFHILEMRDCSFIALKNSLLSAQPSLVIPLDRSANGACKPPAYSATLLQRIEQALEVPAREPYQQPWRYFTPQGEVIASRSGWDKAVAEGPIFLIEGGQFQWPPVRKGFKQKVNGLVAFGEQIMLETLSVKPPIFQINKLSSEEEANRLIEYAKPYFRKSEVVYMDKDKGKKVENFRTSQSHRPAHNATELIATMEARAALLTRIPPEHFEEMQILQYARGGYYHGHDDAARLEFYAKDRNAITRHHYGYFDRMITVFWYMNTVAKGGHTNFPRSDGGPGPPTMKKCVQGLMVPPVQGTAVMWYNMDPRGLVDEHALHAACEVEEGEKYAINVWVYNKPRQQPTATWDVTHPRLKFIKGALTSSESPHPTKRSLSFVNEAASIAQVFWQGPQGSTLVAQMQPGEQHSINTYVGHRFVAKQSTGEFLGEYVVVAAPEKQRYVIVSDGKEL